MNRHLTSLSIVFALALAGCGGKVSLGESGQGTDGLHGDPTADGGVADGAGGVFVDGGDDPGPWPIMVLSALDGGLDDAGEGQFNEVVWNRWWKCDTGICQQQMWINATCAVWWNDRNKIVGQGTLSAVDCKDLMTFATKLDLAGTLQSPALCSGTGAEEIEYHIGGYGGPWYKRRTEGCTGGSFSALDMVRKSVVVGTRAVAGAKESDVHL